MDRPATPFVKPRWLRAVGIVGLALVVSTFAWWPILATYPHSQGHDGTFIQEMLEAARVAMVRYHELPLWNPYQCGGVPLWDNPQGMGAAPLFWPMVALLGNTTLALDLWYVLHAAGGFVSMYILARHDLRLSRDASLVSSGMWAFCGAHVHHCCGGGFNWAPFFFLPLALFLWRGAEKDPRQAVGLGILTGFSFMGGAVYPLAFSGAVLAVETLTRAFWRPRRLRGIVIAALLAGATAGCLSAARLIPVYFQIKAHSRQLAVETDALQWSTLREMFLARSHVRAVMGQEYAWPEFGDYLGPALLALALLGAVMGGVERTWLLVLLVWTFLLMSGHVSPWAPWSLMKAHLFPFKEMRVPSRFNITVTVFLSAFAGVAIDRAGEIARRLTGSARAARAARALFLAIGLVGVGDIISAPNEWQTSSFSNPPLTNLAGSPRLYLGGPGLPAFVDMPQQNRSWMGCWEEWAFERDAPLWEGDVPQARSRDLGAVLTNVSRTQSSFTFDVDAQRPAKILLNGNYDLNWHASVGEAVRSGAQLAVEVPAGSHRVVVKYWPRGLSVGIGISLVTAVAIALFFVVDALRRRRRRT